MKRKQQSILALLLLLPWLASCTYNPFSDDNRLTGSAAGTAIGAGVGAGTVALFGGHKFYYVPAILAGGALGYYFTTLRFQSGGVVQAGGEVYRVGDNIGIYIPTDQLFEPNSAELLPEAGPILDSAATILQRYPDNNILISGNTSGFGRARWEQKLSLARAEKVAAYLWDQGNVMPFKQSGMDVRKLNYVGYGDYFPIATDLNNEGIRQNSRIQITSYPSSTDLHLDKRHVVMRNIGAFKDDTSGVDNTDDNCTPTNNSPCSKD